MASGFNARAERMNVRELQSSKAAKVGDAITQEIINGKLLATVDEMAIVLARTSMSPVVYEVLDFACGICDARGELVAQTNGITIFTGTFSRQVQFILQRFGSDMAPGDTFLTNDPFEGGTHACDFAIIRPIFAGGALIAYGIAVAHLLDVGGAVAGSIPPDATSVYQEGLRLSGVRLTRDDKLHRRHRPHRHGKRAAAPARARRHQRRARRRPHRRAPHPRDGREIWNRGA